MGEARARARRNGPARSPHARPAQEMATKAGPGAERVPRVLEEQGVERRVAPDLQRPGVLRLAGQHHLEVGGDPQPPGRRPRGSGPSAGRRPRARPAGRRRSARSRASLASCGTWPSRRRRIRPHATAPGVVQRMIGRREPFLRVGIEQVERLRGDFARDGVGPVGRQAVLLGVDARRRVQPAVGHRRRRAPGALDIVWSKGRGVNGVRTSERPAVVGELGIGLRGPGRDLAVPDRVERLPASCRGDGCRRRGSGGGARSGRSPAPCRRPGRSGDGPGTIPARAGSGRGAGCRSGRRSGARRCPRPRRTPASPAPAASRGSGPGR